MPIPKYIGINFISLCARANTSELTIEAIRKLTTRLALIALYNSPKKTFLKTNSSKIGPTIEIKIIK